MENRLRIVDPSKIHIVQCPWCYGNGFKVVIEKGYMETHRVKKACSKCHGYGIVKVYEDKLGEDTG